MEQNLADARVSVLAYALMTNHVHWIVIPQREDALAVLFRRVHGRYAQYVNARRRRTGHLWQNRFFSCAVARGHMWSALRYVELNAVRAGMVQEAAGYRWSSAAAHLAGPERGAAGPLLDWGIWREAGGADGWREFLSDREHLAEVVEVRRCTYSGKPYGPDDFVRHMEIRFGRRWRNRGRPPKPVVFEKGPEQTASFSVS